MPLAETAKRLLNLSVVAILAQFGVCSGYAAADWSAPAALDTNSPLDRVPGVSPRFACNGAQLWVAVWVSVGSSGTDIIAARSEDDGHTWGPATKLDVGTSPDPGDSFSPQVAWVSETDCVVVWHAGKAQPGANVAENDLYFSRSEDSGRTFTGAARLSPDIGTGNRSDTFPTIASDRAGHCVVVWSSREISAKTESSDADLYCSSSSDYGATWSPAKPLDANDDQGEDLSPHITTDRAGNWMVVWRTDGGIAGSSGTDFDIFWARSTDNGATWSSPSPLNTDAGTDNSLDGKPGLETDGAGTWIAVWSKEDALGGAFGPDRDILFARTLDGGATWSAPKVLNSDAATDSRSDFDPDIESDGRGNWVAVWYSSKGNGTAPGVDVDAYYSVSSDDGVDWSPLKALNGNAGTDTGNDFAPVIRTDRSGHWLSIWESSERLLGSTSVAWRITRARKAFTGSLAGSIERAGDRSDPPCAAISIASNSANVERVVTADANGQYRVNELPEGEYTVTVYSPGFAPVSVDAVVATDSTALANFTLTPIPLDGGVYGLVTDKTSATPLVGARVAIRSGEELLAVTYSCGDGRYELHAPSGKDSPLTLDVTAQSYQSQFAPINLESGVLVEFDADLIANSIAGAPLAGTVRSKDGGGPIANASITFEGRANIAASTGEDGSFGPVELPEGIYAAHASAPGFEGQTLEAVVRNSETAALDFELRTPGDREADINSDSNVDAVDVQLVLNAALSLSDRYDCDVDGDGVINAIDIQLVVNAALEIAAQRKETTIDTGAWLSRAGFHRTKGDASPATVFWMCGEDGDGNWNNPGNWSTGVVPGPDDVVVISRPGLDLSIVIPSGSRTVNRLICDERLTLAGGALTITGNSAVNAAFTVAPGATLTVTGAGVTFTSSGPTVLDGAVVLASDHAAVRFPTLATSANTTFSSSSGASIGLAALTSSSQTNYIVDSTSVLELPSVNVAAGSVFTITGTGNLALPAFTSLTNVRFELKDGAVVDLPSLTSYTSTLDDAGIFVVDGVGSALNLPHLNALNISGGVAGIEATRGGRIDLRGLHATNVQTALRLVAAGGGALNVSGLTNSPHTTFEVGQSSTLNLLALSIADDCAFNADGSGEFVLPSFSQLHNATFALSGGANLSLPTVTSYSWDHGDATIVNASGFGSKLDLPALSALTISNGTCKISASNSGAVNLAALQNPTVASGIIVSVSGRGSVDLGTLKTCSRTEFEVGPMSTLDLPSLASVSGAKFSVSGSGELNLPPLPSMVNAQFIIGGGAIVSLPAVTTYMWTSTDATFFSVNGPGSSLNLPNLTLLTVGGGSGTIIAANGGQIAMPKLQTSLVVFGLKIAASGGGIIDLPALKLSTNTEYAVDSGSTLSLPSIADASGSKFSIDGSGTLLVPAFKSLTNVRFVLSGGAVLSLPSVTTYTWALGNTPILVANGAGSRLEFPNLALFTLLAGSNAISATSGARISLPLLGAVVTTSGSSLSASSIGAQSTIDLSTLKAFDPARTSFNELNGGVILRP